MWRLEFHSWFIYLIFCLSSIYLKKYSHPLRPGNDAADKAVTTSMWHLILLLTTKGSATEPFLLPSASLCPCESVPCPLFPWREMTVHEFAAVQNSLKKKISEPKMIVLIYQIPGKYPSIVCYSQISRSTGFQTISSGFSTIHTGNTPWLGFCSERMIRHSFRSLLWINYALTNQISRLWHGLIKVSGY